MTDITERKRMEDDLFRKGTDASDTADPLRCRGLHRCQDLVTYLNPWHSA